MESHIADNLRWEEISGVSNYAVKTSVIDNSAKTITTNNELVSFDKLSVVKTNESSIVVDKYNSEKEYIGSIAIHKPSNSIESFGSSICINHDASKIFISDTGIRISQYFAAIKGKVYLYEYDKNKNTYILTHEFIPEITESNTHVIYGVSISCDLEGIYLAVGCSSNSSKHNNVHLYTHASVNINGRLLKDLPANELWTTQHHNLDLDNVNLVTCSVSMSDNGGSLAIAYMARSVISGDTKMIRSLRCIGTRILGKKYIRCVITEIVDDLLAIAVKVDLLGDKVLLAETTGTKMGKLSTRVHVYDLSKSTTEETSIDCYQKTIEDKSLNISNSYVESICFDNEYAILGMCVTVDSKEEDPLTKVSLKL